MYLWIVIYNPRLFLPLSVDYYAVNSKLNQRHPAWSVLMKYVNLLDYIVTGFMYTYKVLFHLIVLLECFNKYDYPEHRP